MCCFKNIRITTFYQDAPVLLNQAFFCALFWRLEGARPSGKLSFFLKCGSVFSKIAQFLSKITQFFLKIAIFFKNVKKIVKSHKNSTFEHQENAKTSFLYVILSQKPVFALIYD